MYKSNFRAKNLVLLYSCKKEVLWLTVRIKKNVSRQSFTNITGWKKESLYRYGFINRHRWVTFTCKKDYLSPHGDIKVIENCCRIPWLLQLKFF